jgi:hypothetical protein
MPHSANQPLAQAQGGAGATLTPRPDGALNKSADLGSGACWQSGPGTGPEPNPSAGCVCVFDELCCNFVIAAVNGELNQPANPGALIPIGRGSNTTKAGSTVVLLPDLLLREGTKVSHPLGLRMGARSRNILETISGARQPDQDSAQPAQPQAFSITLSIELVLDR